MIKHNIFSEPLQTLPKSSLRRGDSGEELSGHKNYKIDMDVSVVVQPIKLTFRPMEIEKLINFFYVEDLKPETRSQAQKLKLSLTNRLNSHVKQSIEMHEWRKRKNKVKIEIICPVLEVPFSNNPQWRDEEDK
jgi:hypothetical protein